LDLQNDENHNNHQIIIRSFSHENLQHYSNRDKDKHDSSKESSHHDAAGDADDEGTEEEVEEEEEEEVELKHKQRRSLSFCDRLKVVLIPSRKDYQSCGLLDTMWWQPGDYVYFKDDAKAEVFDVMKSKQLDSSQAIRYLYHEIQSSSSEDTKTSLTSVDSSSDDDSISSSYSSSSSLVDSEDSLPEFLELYAKQRPRDRSDSLLPFSGLV
jgi:hypothetical protein